MSACLDAQWHAGLGGGLWNKGSSYRCACLYVKAPHGLPVVHGVESGHFVDAHRGHLKQTGDFVHDTDAGEAVLSLAEV